MLMKAVAALIYDSKILTVIAHFADSDEMSELDDYPSRTFKLYIFAEDIFLSSGHVITYSM